MATKTKEPKGKCFEASYLLLVAGSWNGNVVDVYVGEPMLVHGIVWHEETDYHGHAWIEDVLFCYDFIGGVVYRFPKHYYYNTGKIKKGEGELFKYTREEAMDLADKTGYYAFTKLPCDK